MSIVHLGLNAMVLYHLIYISFWSTFKIFLPKNQTQNFPIPIKTEIGKTVCELHFVGKKSLQVSTVREKLNMHQLFMS